MKFFQSILMLIARIAISIIFFAAAYDKITHWETTISDMASKGIGQTSIFLFLACMIEFIGGLSLVFGFKIRWAAGILALFLIPVTLLFHNFWSYSGSEANLQMIMFMKNLAIIGGLSLRVGIRRRIPLC